jgi:hypothetical protein
MGNGPDTGYGAAPASKKDQGGRLAPGGASDVPGLPYPPRRFAIMSTTIPRRGHLLRAVAVAAALLLLAACGGGGGSSTTTTSAANARSDSDLQAIADALYLAHYSAFTPPDAVDQSSGDNVGTALEENASTAVDSSETSAGFSTAALSIAPQLMAATLNAEAQRLALEMSRSTVSATSRPLQAISVTPTACGNGSYDASGTGTETITGSGDTARVAIRLSDLDINLNGCDDNAANYEVWAQLRFNAYDVLTLTAVDPPTDSIFDVTVSFDQYHDGGVALYDNVSNHYDLIFRHNLLGHLSAQVDTNASTVSNLSGSFGVSMQVNTVHCTGTASIDSNFNASDASYTCVIP